jgi:hypothetical protein
MKNTFYVTLFQSVALVKKNGRSMLFYTAVALKTGICEASTSRADSGFQTERRIAVPLDKQPTYPS